MARFKDSPGLFGYGAGTSTTGGLTCELCHNEYPEQDPSDEGHAFAWFAGLQVVDCCFERIENAVLNSVSDIIPWYTEILKARRKRLEADEARLAALRQAESGTVALRPEQGGHRFSLKDEGSADLCEYKCGVMQARWGRHLWNCPDPAVDIYGRCPNSPFNESCSEVMDGKKST